ncbi:uncharacterized protein TNCV_1724921 [Trichonephila clavipes]|nr:uncharacterized protein TNCV_1724921 [Trichonephila clavipes]
MSSCAEEQFRSDASLEAVDRQAENDSKNWQWTAEGPRATIDTCTTKQLFLLVVSSTMVGVLMSASAILRRRRHRGLRASCLYAGFI